MFVAAQSLGALYRASYAANRIDIFNDAASLSGNVAPARSLSGAGTTLHNPSGLAVDQTRNGLCVASRRVASRRVGPASLTTRAPTGSSKQRQARWR